MQLFFMFTILSVYLLQVCASAKAKIPQIPEINIHDAIDMNPNASVSFSASFGRSCNSGNKFSSQIIVGQSESYRDVLEQGRMVNLCKKHAQNGHTLSYACRNATRTVNLFDSLKFYVDYNWVTLTNFMFLKLRKIVIFLQYVYFNFSGSVSKQLIN